MGTCLSFGTPALLDFSRRFCIHQFSADVQRHEVALQSRKLNLLLCFFLDEAKKQKVADQQEDDKYTCCACGGATYDITFTGKVIIDEFKFLGNCPPTPPLSHHFALSEK